MFIGTLNDFQEKHEQNLLRACATSRDLVLSAPTGTGKTVLASKFIEDYFEENPNTTFLWLCPGAGALQSQSQERFNQFTVNTKTGDIFDFINESNPRGSVYFVNWDKINRSSNVALRDGDRKNLFERVDECKRLGIDIFMLIDEEHAYRETAAYFEAELQPKHILRMSATVLATGDHTEVITDDEAIAAGLISKGISINEGVAKAIEENNSFDDDKLLIKLADEKRKEITKAYESIGLNIKPLVLIQFPNGDDEWIRQIENELEGLGYSKDSGFVSHWFSGDHPDNIDEIVKPNGEVRFLLFKQAIATGWDCPRAKILVKLREGGTEQFNIQVIGRIRRMPEHRHYNIDLLDYCFLYTLDATFKDGLASSMLDSFYTYTHKRKNSIQNVNLIQERLDGSDRYAINEKAVVEVIKNKMLEKCDLNKDGCLTKEELETAKGFNFSTSLKARSIEGVTRTLSVSEINRLESFYAGEHELSNHYDSLIIRDAKRKIASSMGIDEKISSKVLYILFGPSEYETQTSLLYSEEDIEYERNNKLIKDMTLTEYNAFLVNNKEKIIEILQELKKEDFVELEETEIIEKAWNIPREQFYKEHKVLNSMYTLEKNAFEDYGSNILIAPNRSFSEMTFENWCENMPFVEWVYKNGDKGEDFFSIVYYRSLARAHFYPDYIVKTVDGKIWIIETKGGQKATGETENIDADAKKKFDALKEYAVKHPEIKWGFVRPAGQQLFISNTSWEESMNNREIWKPIGQVIVSE